MGGTHKQSTPPQPVHAPRRFAVITPTGDLSGWSSEEGSHMLPLLPSAQAAPAEAGVAVPRARKVVAGSAFVSPQFLRMMRCVAVTACGGAVVAR
jgi:hypothetical protein